MCSCVLKVYDSWIHRLVKQFVAVFIMNERQLSLLRVCKSAEWVSDRVMLATLNVCVLFSC